ncbi:MAG: hypothetical protein WCS42_20070 [Verrucomicrobiota bacterium]
MVFNDLIKRLTSGVQRDDLVDSYPGILNEALMEIQRRRSFQCMKKLDEFVIPSGQRSVPLTLLAGLFPVGTTYDSAGMVVTTGLTTEATFTFTNQEAFAITASATGGGGRSYQDFGEVKPGASLTFTLFNGNTEFSITGGTVGQLLHASLTAAGAVDTARFKELTTSQSPIHLRNSESVLTPCDVWTREKVLRRRSRLIPNSTFYSVFLTPFTTRRVQLPVWIEWRAAQPVLNILVQAQTDLPFEISYYGYLPELVNPTDANYFTTNYPEMVLAKAKSIAFETINDPIAVDFEKLFEARFTSAAGQDAYSALAGITLRM